MDHQARSGLEEVIVTARRRSESVQDVPVAVSVLSGEALQMRSVTSEGDLQVAFPGLVVRSANNNNQLNYVIRGESVDAYSGSPPGVQPYINDVPFLVGASTTFFDLGNIQVVKGPQGTLFGRNSTGGAVLFQTKEPEGQFGGYASIQYGNLDSLIAEGAINIPVSDKLKFRLAGTASSGGDWVKNLYDNQTLGGKDEQSARFTIAFDPSERLSNVTTIQVSESDGTNAPNAMYYTIPCGEPSGFNSCLYHPDVPAFQKLLNGEGLQGYPTGNVHPGGFENLPEFLRSQGDYVVSANASFFYEASSKFFINKTDFDISPTLSIKNILGYTHSENALNYDTDYSPYPIVQQYAPSALLQEGPLPVESGEWETWSNEFQLLGTAFDERLDYLLGVFYIDSEEKYYSPLTIMGIDPPDTVLQPSSVAYNAVTGNESTAVFGQGTYELTDNLNLTVGARYTWEEVTMTQGSESIFLYLDPEPFGGIDLPQKSKQEDSSWTVSLDYHLTDQIMVYATTRGSWRRGGFNPFNPPTPQPTTAATGGGGNYFLPEQIRDVEGGVKFDGFFGEVPVRANLALYQSWVDDIQKTAYVVIGGTASSATINVPETEISGFEADIHFEANSWLRLGGSVAHTDAEFTKPDSLLFGNTVTYGPFGDAPEWSGTLFADMSMELGEGRGYLNYRVDVYAQSHFYFSNLGGTIQPGTKLPGYTLVNMRLDWNDIFGSRVKGSLFVKNLGEKVYYTGGSAGAQNFSVESATFGKPRIYGLQLRVDF
ncbi:TonB-dependent receptor [Kineobactrum salinum]|uniref:TonB-dependent receptor n=1 Tax=Kineobactrum salinum TaxID=2708301 RepID=A0A6C0U3T9_9GAMM|nr:TonB-dependent receptor [Kineobactrum salinum]QIB66830.1 TonB-dependent receptor [Kineobactrum salinum]